MRKALLNARIERNLTQEEVAPESGYQPFGLHQHRKGR